MSTKFPLCKILDDRGNVRLYGWMHKKRSNIYYGRKDMGWIQFETGMKESKNG